MTKIVWGQVRASVVAASVGLAVGLGGVAWATIPDAAGVIHACYKAQNGQLRVIDVSLGQSCVPSEVALQWSQTGPGGSQGLRVRKARSDHRARRAIREFPAVIRPRRSLAPLIRTGQVSS